MVVRELQALLDGMPPEALVLTTDTEGGDSPCFSVTGGQVRIRNFEGRDTHWRFIDPGTEYLEFNDERVVPAVLLE